MCNSTSNTVTVHLVLEVYTDSHQVNIILVHEADKLDKIHNIWPTVQNIGT